MARLTAIIAIIFALIQFNASFTIKDDVVDRETKRFQEFLDNITDVLDTESKIIDTLKNIVDAKIVTANSSIKAEKDKLDQAIADEIAMIIWVNDVCLYCVGGATDSENNMNLTAINACSETLNLETTEAYKKINQLSSDTTKIFTKCKTSYTTDDDFVTCVENDITSGKTLFDQLVTELKEEIDRLHQDALDCVANDEKNFIAQFESIRTGMYACVGGCMPGPGSF